MTEDKAWAPRRKHKRQIYYKVQTYDEVSLTWKDERGAYDDIEGARSAATTKPSGKTVRIMQISGTDRKPIAI